MKPIRCLALAAGLALVACLGTAVAASAPPYPGLIAFTDTSSGSGEIGVMRSDGSERRLLTRYLPLMAQPAASPDGKTIAFILGSSIALMRSDGSHVRRITGARFEGLLPVWSPQGRLAFVRRLHADARPEVETVEIVVADASGRHQHVLTREQLDEYPRLAWSSTGRHLLYGPGGADGASSGFDESIDARTGHETPVRVTRACTFPIARPGHPGDVACTSTDYDSRDRIWLHLGDHRVEELELGLGTIDDGLDLEPSWSPDGSAIAYGIDEKRVAVVRVGRTGVRQRTFVIGAFPRNSTSPLHVTWAGNDHSLVVGTEEPGWGIARLDTATGRVRTIAQHAEDGTPRWAPGGRALAYLHRTRGGATQLVTRPLEGVSIPIARIGPEAGDGSFAWAPDGNSLAYVYKTVLRVADVASGVSRTVVAAGFTGGIAWSPDGATLAYEADGYQVALAAVDGGPAPGWPAPGPGSSPTWTRDGRLLFLGRNNRGGGYADVTLLDPTARQPVPASVYASHIAASPVDSSFLAASGRENGSFYFLSIGRADEPGVPGYASALDPGTWSPDGAAIAFSTGESHGVGFPDSEVAIAVAPSSSLSDSTATVIADNATDPSWGPGASTG